METSSDEQIDNILATNCQQVDNKVNIFSIYYWQQIESNAETDWERASDSNKLATCWQQIVNMLETNKQNFFDIFSKCSK